MNRLYNLVAVIDAAGENLLFCLRRRPPYQGLYNFVGGKIEPGEEHLRAAYRELREETGIPEDAIGLVKVMCLEYPMEDCRMEVYAGRLNRPVEPVAELNELAWLPVGQDYADVSRFAGVGNLGHIVQYIRAYTDLLDGKEKLLPSRRAETGASDSR